MRPLFLGGLVFAIFTLNAQARIVFSGDVSQAKLHLKTLQFHHCSQSQASSCALEYVRFYQDYALYHWREDEIEGYGISKRQHNQWRKVITGGGALTQSEAIARGVPVHIGQFLVPVVGTESPQSPGKLSPDLLKTLSPWEKLVLRNYFYARHGRRFTHKKLRHYFETFSWYKADPQFTSQRLTREDHENIQRLLSVVDP